MKISIVIPFYNEEENVQAVLREVQQTLPEAEIIAVNDGSRDRTAEMIRSCAGVRLISFPRNLGQSAALYAGLIRARNEICVMMDGDGQNDPADIPRLVAGLDQADLVCGYRDQRQDSWLRRAASRIANTIRQAALRDGIRDTGCTLKAMRTADVRHLVPFNGLHRFIPALLRGAGLRVWEIPVNHRPRKFGASKYTLARRAWRGLRDLIGVRWLLARQIAWPRKEEIEHE
ncbi:MAG: glycosyltransferase family 2 protein [Verrucomicrobia bacterium]|nr:glycosyltransferase family 2 protein [Verrucomicrobiota bacterium]